MPPTLSIASGLYAWTLTLENGDTRKILASSLDAAISGVLPSPVVGATRGAPVDGLGQPPVLTSLTPASAKLGDPSFTLHVIGTGFTASDVILWNGSPETTTFVSATELTTGVDMSTAVVAMAIPVSVRIITGLESNALPFDLQP